MTGVTAAKGFLASAIRAGLKQKGLDLALISSPSLCQAAGVFTRNSIKAAPVILSQLHLRDGKAQAIVVNSGCANACTGREGLEAARRMTRKTAELLGIRESDVLVASTGIIGERLPIEKIEKTLPALVDSLGQEGGKKASQAILTTDTRPKDAVITLRIGGKRVTIGGMAKGSGMISPSMATLLSFVTTDVNITNSLLKKALREKVQDSFNQVVVDGDMSTNDSLFILANGQAENPVIAREGRDYLLFAEALGEILKNLSRQIAEDGEGATRLIEVKVIKASNLREARITARFIVQSNLVKAMVFGQDPNWGRILAAIGSGVDVRGEKVKIWIEGVEVFSHGQKARFNQKILHKKMAAKKVSFLVALGKGKAQAMAWGCDLTPAYVHINAHYRT